METLKRNILSFASVIFACYIGPGMQGFLLAGIYYILSAMTYVIANIVYESTYLKYKRKIKRIKRIIERSRGSVPIQVNKFTDWLKHEGFTVRVNNNGNFFLQSKNTKIDYFPTLDQKLHITSVKEKSSEYLTYEEDEELKMKIEDYLGFITFRDKEYQKSQNSFIALNASSTQLLTSETIFSRKFIFVFIRLQGYIFLILAFMNIRNDDMPVIVKFCIFMSYFILEAI